jgi:transposase
MSKKRRRKYTKEFKEEAVRLISEEGYSYAEAGRNLGVNPNLLSRWKREFEGIELDPGSAAAMQAELKRLRKENKRLKMEREILKKAAAFFAKEQK